MTSRRKAERREARVISASDWRRFTWRERGPDLCDCLVPPPMVPRFAHFASAEHSIAPGSRRESPILKLHGLKSKNEV
jgi:hypothetical protein